MFYQHTIPPPRRVLLSCTYKIRATKGYYLLQQLISIKLTLGGSKDPVFMVLETDYPQPAGQTARQDRQTHIQFLRLQ